MAPFITLDDYADLLGEPVDPVRAFFALDAACDVVRRYLGQQIDLVTADVITINGSGTRALLLPELPVVAVTTVLVDAVAVTDYTVDLEAGILWRDYWAYPTPVTITYDHGFAIIPGDIRFVTCKVAQSIYDNVGAGTVRQHSESLGSWSESFTYADTGTNQLSALERRIVKRVPVP